MVKRRKNACSSERLRRKRWPEYSLSAKGLSLEPVIAALKAWGEANIHLAPAEL
jgi:DNA-binding HxlR family transcriptional regulator